MTVYKINNEHWVAGPTKDKIVKWYKRNYPSNNIEEIEKTNIHTDGLYVDPYTLTENELNNDVKMFRKIDDAIICFMTFDTVIEKAKREDCYLIASMPQKTEDTKEEPNE